MDVIEALASGLKFPGMLLFEDDWGQSEPAARQVSLLACRPIAKSAFPFRLF